ncbi:MAG: ACP S-malonyltransferase [Simkaniaceae bacterium]|nr:ACP S-malonyltransferase [Simkaniaceae bacterium]
MRHRKIAIIFPGQGAQYPGMGLDFYENRNAAKEVFQMADELMGENFSRTIFEGDAQELSQTQISQPAIYITSYALYRSLITEIPEVAPYCVGGLSLGEYTALAVSNRLTFDHGLKLVQARGAYMQEASERNPGTLAAVLGIDEPQVTEVLRPFQEQGARIWIANMNCPGQVVIAGEKPAIQVVEPVLKDRGAKRIIFLDVSGAFHTPLMKPAQDRLAPMIEAVSMNDSPIKFTSNVTGGFVSNISEIKHNLIAQVASPTRWESNIRAMQADGVELFIEVGCGKSLAGMNRKIQPGAPTVSVDKLSDLKNVELALNGQTVNNS